MDKEFQKFIADLRLQRRKCPWAAKQGVAGQLRELESEIKEMRKALKKSDLRNLREEYGDVLWDALMLGVIAEEKGLFPMRKALAGANAKLRRRKPWVFGKEKVRSSAEAVKRWNEIKKREKAAKKRE
ncbi:MAG: nucleotide pyrophosphohydrolase [Candidatus Diapherotrites archaeon]|nr:nucleotide pyrophosphohydrolase [Candidatus Diapherotrites archaeon]